MRNLTLRCCCLCLALLLLAAAAAAAEPVARPSAADVAGAVAASRAANVPSQAEHVAKLMGRRRRELFILAQYEQSAIPKKTLLAQRKRVRDLERQIIKDGKHWDPPPAEDAELSRLVWSELDIGTVGRATLRGARYTYRCQQILGPDSLLLLVMHEGEDLCTVHLANYPTGRLQEGLRVDLECDVVVVGRYQYETALGVSRDVPSLERFNPDIEFE